jgi:hypothetical protein
MDLYKFGLIEKKILDHGVSIFNGTCEIKGYLQICHGKKNLLL